MPSAYATGLHSQRALNDPSYLSNVPDRVAENSRPRECAQPGPKGDLGSIFCVPGIGGSLTEQDSSWEEVRKEVCLLLVLKSFV